LKENFDRKQAAKDASYWPAKEFPTPTSASARMPDTTKKQKNRGWSVGF